MFVKRISIFISGLLASTMLVAIAPATPAAAATSVPKAVNGKLVTGYLRERIRGLRVAAEVRTGYDRSKFKLWDDVDHDCQNTRAEVLITESLRATTGSCTIDGGKWFSFYDRRRFFHAGNLDIDHMVPLAEAWDSGARNWNAGRREAYANDLTDPRPLVAVSASSNRSKGDRDPAEWLPTYGKCRYLMAWTVTKLRWRLSVDRPEKRAMIRLSKHCADKRLRTHRAVVTWVGTGTSGGGGGTGLDPRFGTCAEAKANGYGPYYDGVDPEYDWYYDADHDGIVCE